MKRYIKSSKTYNNPRFTYIDECLDNAPQVPDYNDSEEAWSQYYRDLSDYRSWCFVDAVEDDLFDDNEYDEFKRLWEMIETRRAAAWS